MLVYLYISMAIAKCSCSFTLLQIAWQTKVQLGELLYKRSQIAYKERKEETGTQVCTSGEKQAIITALPFALEWKPDNLHHGK